MPNYHSMFKAYDLRGTYPDLNAKVYYWAAYGFVAEIVKPQNLPSTIPVVHDCRYTSPEFYKAFCNGLKDAGATPLPLGMGSTDFMYAAAQLLDTPGVMITASHNPKDDNGIKIVKKTPHMLGLSAGLDKVRDYVLKHIEVQEIDTSNWYESTVDENLKTKVWEYFLQKYDELGQVKQVDTLLAQQNRKLKIVVDAGNGMGGFVMEKIKDLYSHVEFIPLFWEPDGTYPNHPADPQNVDNLKDLQKAVLEFQADFGIAFDGDADRAYFVDEKGIPVQGDFLVAYFAKYILKQYQPSSEFDKAVVYIQPGSRCVREVIAENDGVSVPSKQGHTYIKAEMSKHNALYGGEFSGHHYFGNFKCMDSGLLAVALFIKIIVSSGITVSQTFAKLAQTYFISNLINLKIPVGDTFEIWKEKLKNYFADAEFSEFDGLSMYYPDWKFSMRASNTEPLVRFILETRGVDTINEKVAQIKKIVGVD